MSEITIALISVVVLVAAVYFIVKMNRTTTSGEISDLHKQIHEGIGKIDLLTTEVRQLCLGGNKENEGKNDASTPTGQVD